MAASNTRANVAVSASHLLRSYVPGPVSESDPTTWLNAAAIVGLEDVSFLLLPDLPELVGVADVPPPISQPAVPQGPEVFVECDATQSFATQLPDSSAAMESAPRCDQAAYGLWQQTIQSIVSTFAGMRVSREAQLLVALPLPSDPANFGSGNDLIPILPNDAPAGAITPFGSGFVQVCYPWLVSDESALLPEGIIPPDGTLAGILARNAISSGAYKDASRTIPNQIYDTFPQLSGDTYTIPEEHPAATNQSILVELVSFFGPTPAGYRLLSDVTTSQNGNYRLAPIRRLMEMLNRAARQTGEALLFMPSGPRLWGRVQGSLTALLTRFWQAGALDGESMNDAFWVRCDRSTMLQADIDAGRVIAQVTLTPAWSIESIRVTLVVSSGDITQVSPAAIAEVA
jgi:hypothetical protein